MVMLDTAQFEEPQIFSLPAYLQTLINRHGSFPPPSVGSSSYRTIVNREDSLDGTVLRSIIIAGSRLPDLDIVY